jgi:hypothetical protein
VNASIPIGIDAKLSNVIETYFDEGFVVFFVLLAKA